MSFINILFALVFIALPLVGLWCILRDALGWSMAVMVSVLAVTLVLGGIYTASVLSKKVERAVHQRSLADRPLGGTIR